MDDTTDVDTVERYGRATPAAYGGVWLDGDRLQVGVTSETGLHAARLRVLLENPERVDVVPVPWTVAHLGGVRVEAERVAATHPGVFRTSASGRRGVTLGLRADGEQVASDLHDRFGKAITLTVGGRPYPAPTDWGPVPEPPTANGSAAGVDLQLRVDGDEVPSGQDFTATLVVHNTQSTPILLTGGAIQVATVLDAHGAVVGMFTGPMSAAGMARPVHPNRTVSIPVLGGTAGVDRYATPPGHYLVVVPLNVTQVDSQERRRLLGPPVPLTIT